MCYVPLHVHSQYSILDAASSIRDLVKKAASFHMPALALTDHGNLFGAVDFYKACKEAGIKPIVGCELYLAPTSRFEKKKISGKPVSYHITVLAKNNTGYRNLCKLCSIGYIDGFYYTPRIDLETLLEHKEGLICLSGCLRGHIPQYLLNESAEDALALIRTYKDAFQDDFYFELQRHEMSEDDLHADGIVDEGWLHKRYQEATSQQRRVNEKLLELSKELGIRCVATPNIHYIERQDWHAHEILLNVQSGEPCEIWEKDSQGNPKQRLLNPKRDTFFSHESYFKSPDQMAELFADCPQAIQESLLIAEKCKVEIDFKTKHYPVYYPPGVNSQEVSKEKQPKLVEEFLWKLCKEGIPKRYTPDRLAKVAEKYPGQDPMEVVQKRLDYEMGIIVPKGMCDYLLIVWDFINWAKSQGIPVGPGRGSGAGSIILYLIGVTDIEPLRFSLFFERFINPERISYPDIDVDICMDRRGEVLAYTIQKYGHENVAQIVTFGTMKAKMAVKDVGRVLNVPLAKVNAIAKLIPEDLNITIEKALEKDPELNGLYSSDEEARRLLDIARRLEGSIRNTGIHAAGMIICGDALTNHIPVFLPKESEMLATQFAMKPVESVGMLKIDFLGLKTLTCIQVCCNALKASRNIVVDWTDLPLDNEATFSLLNQGKTLGVFQLESGGMQDLAKQLHLDKFEEVIAVLSLYRPGPMDMIPSFIQRKHGKEPIEIDHPWMADILSETYGIMVYQEQVMQIASKLANYSLGEGDVLRRAMGKKDMQEMTKQREKFCSGAMQNGIEEETAGKIFDKMEKFAAYGFNKSHAAAYGYLTYVTAYLKANYPGEWLAALMTCDADDLSKVAKFIHEAQQMGLPILSPDINESGPTFNATPQGIRFALSGIKGIGTGVVDAIVEGRTKGPYLSLYDFLKRADKKRVGKKAVENLIDAGCLDFTNWSRDALRESLDEMYDDALRQQKEQSLGVLSLFGHDDSKSRWDKPPKVKHPLDKQALLIREKELLGFFLTGHPLDRFRDVMQQLSCIPLVKAASLDQDAVFRAAFLIEDVQTRYASRSNKKFAILTISDGLERYELPIWPDLFEEKGTLLEENRLIYAVLSVDKKEDEIKLNCKWMDDLTLANEQMMEACDQAYDKVKMFIAKSNFNKASQAEKSENRPKATTTPKKPVEEKIEIKPILIRIDIDQLRMSHILNVQKLIRESQGSNPVTIRFESTDRVVSELAIDSKWNMQFASHIQNELLKIPSVKAVSLVAEKS